MINSGAKIINLEDYIQDRSRLKMEDVKDILSTLRRAQHALDDDVTVSIFQEHKSKHMEPSRDRALKYEAVIKRVSYFLDERIAETDDVTRKAAQEELLKQCEKLKKNNDDIKKVITDDIATCLHNEKENSIDLVRAAGAMLVTPFSVQKAVETFFSHKPEILALATNAGAFLGAYIAFAKQINGCGRRAVKVAVHLPGHIKIVRRSARNAAFALTMSVSVATKRNGNIEMRPPDRLDLRPKTMIVARM